MSNRMTIKLTGLSDEQFAVWLGYIQDDPDHVIHWEAGKERELTINASNMDGVLYTNKLAIAEEEQMLATGVGNPEQVDPSKVLGEDPEMVEIQTLPAAEFVDPDEVKLTKDVSNKNNWDAFS